MKRLSHIALASALVLSACSSAPTTDTDNDTMDEDMDMSASSSPFYLEEDSASSDGVVIDVRSAPATSQPAASAPSANNGQTRVITVNVTDWSFSPAMITAKKGEKVQLKLVGGTGIHSFAVPGLSMNVRLAAGETVTVDLPTDTTGTFDARCAIPCGAGHRDMKATVVITA